MDYSCVIVAAGSGSRTKLDYNKVFHKINNKTVIEMSVSNFINDFDCKQIVLVVNPIEKKLFEDLDMSDKIEFVEGGKSRQESVYNGLQVVSEDFVMIHDGARPFISDEIIEKVKLGLNDYDACVVMVKSIDTVKVVEDGIVAYTPKRETLYNAQTPQAFKTGLIINCYKYLIKQNLSVTDDAQAVEIMSDEEIFVIEGDYSNIKITTAEDLE